MLETEKNYKTAHVNLGHNKDSLMVENAKRIIFERNGCIQRQELAKQLNYSNEHLSRVFKNLTGYTLKYYCQQMQMQEAARLLQSTNLSISQIATSLGYENRTHFYKVFRNIFQASPAEYRAKINKKE